MDIRELVVDKQNIRRAAGRYGPQILVLPVPLYILNLAKPCRCTRLICKQSSDFAKASLRNGGHDDNAIKALATIFQKFKESGSRKDTYRVGNQCAFEIQGQDFHDW